MQKIYRAWVDDDSNIRTVGFSSYRIGGGYKIKLLTAHSIIVRNVLK